MKAIEISIIVMDSIEKLGFDNKILTLSELFDIKQAFMLQTLLTFANRFLKTPLQGLEVELNNIKEGLIPAFSCDAFTILMTEDSDVVYIRSYVDGKIYKSI